MEIGRNEPCPCGSGKKYKKCCLGKSNNLVNYIVKCSICDKNFDRRLPGTFKSIEQNGRRIYFCPRCNLDLICSFCHKKLGNKSFELYECSGCGGVTIICIDCVDAGKEVIHHHG